MSAWPVAGAEWLASAHPSPETARRQWANPDRRCALIPAGVQWDAIRIERQLAVEVLRELHVMRRAGAPVLWGLREGSARAYLLVPPGTAQTWDEPPTRAIGAGGWVAMPRPGAQSRVPDRFRWGPAPDGSGCLADPDALRAAIHRAHGGCW
ncbi:hypothetical protein [Streptomyces sp. NPDC018045]|uniref:hypothetical protein n=1 Tax=Streptomyces sp. NPDC018045 TaxID=3365037 RepID=UPI0037AEE7A3